MKMGSLLLVFLLPQASVELPTAPALILPLFKIISWVIEWKLCFRRLICWWCEGQTEKVETLKVWKMLPRQSELRKIPLFPLSSVLNNLGGTTRTRWSDAFNKFSVFRRLSYRCLATSDAPAGASSDVNPGVSGNFPFTPNGTRKGKFPCFPCTSSSLF